MPVQNHQTVMLALAAALLTAVAQPALAQGKTLYRWVDEKGQVHYGDKVPAKDSKQGREAINKNGTVSKVIPRELAGTELQQAQARAAAAKISEEAHQQRIVHDRYLLQSFGSVADLQAAREERLTALDARASLAQAAVVDNEKTLADLRSRVVSGKPVNPTLKQQIESFENSLIDNLQASRKLRDERASTELQYTADIERFKALRAGTIKQGE